MIIQEFEEVAECFINLIRDEVSSGGSARDDDESPENTYPVVVGVTWNVAG
jgi:hypothetical protein